MATKSTKEIRRRIKSINSTKKITRAMEMVSAAKMRKAVSQALQIRPYALSAWHVLTNLAESFNEYKNDLLEVREVKNILIITIASNRGLCGSFNSQIAKKIKEEIIDLKKLTAQIINGEKTESGFPKEEIGVNFITIGKKSEKMAKKTGKEIIASFPDLNYMPSVEDILPLSRMIIDDYLAKKYDKILIIYTDYISTVVQKVRIRQLLPISRIDLEEQIHEMSDEKTDFKNGNSKLIYKVEPGNKEVLDNIFPRLIEMQIYHTIVESNASEESARMMAMRNATDAAGEMVDGLTLAYNQLRQMKITQEIAEISAGRAAIEN